MKPVQCLCSSQDASSCILHLSSLLVILSSMLCIILSPLFFLASPSLLRSSCWGFRSLLIRPPASLWLLVAALHFGVLGLIFSFPKARERLVYRSWHSLVPELAPQDSPFRGASVVPSWSTEPSVLVRDVNAALGFTGVISFAHLASPNLCLTRHLRSDSDSLSYSSVSGAMTSRSTLSSHAALSIHRKR